MTEKQVRLERLTRREFREARLDGQFRSAIIATGAIEQHLEHLTLEQDIASSTYVAERVAEKLYPDVIVAVPVSIGISEHHMEHPGTLSAKPGSWLAVLYDSIESLVRHGINKVLVLNGHGGNRTADRVIRQWQLHLEHTAGTQASVNDSKPIDLRFLSYWEAIPDDFVEQVQETKGFPSHAKEFETSIMMYIAPDNVRTDSIGLSKDTGASVASASKGEKLVNRAVDGVSEIVVDMLET